MPLTPSNSNLSALEKLPLELKQDIFSRAVENDASTFANLQRVNHGVRRNLLDSPFIRKKRKEAALIACSLGYNCGHGGDQLAVEAKMADHFMYLNKKDVPKGGIEWRNEFARDVREVLNDVEDLEHNQGRKVRRKRVLNLYDRSSSNMRLTDEQIVKNYMRNHDMNENDPYIKDEADMKKQCTEILSSSFGMLFNNPDRYRFPNCLQNLKIDVIQAHLRHSDTIDYATVNGLTSDPALLSERDCEALARITLQKNKDYDDEHSEGDEISNEKFTITEQLGYLGRILYKLTPETRKSLVDYALSPDSYNASERYEADMIGGLAQGARHLEVDDHQSLLTASLNFKAKVESGDHNDEHLLELLLELLSKLAIGCKNLPPDRQHMKDQVFNMIKDFHDKNAQQLVLCTRFENLKSLVSIYTDLTSDQRKWVIDTVKVLDKFYGTDVYDFYIKNINSNIYKNFGREACVDVLKLSFIKNFSPILPEMKQKYPQEIDNVFNVFRSISSDFVFVNSARIFSESELSSLTRQQFDYVKKRLNSIETLQNANEYINTEMKETLDSYKIAEENMKTQKRTFRKGEAHTTALPITRI